MAISSNFFLFQGADGRQLRLAGHVGFDSLPDQLVNKSVNRGFAFNILCIGKSEILLVQSEISFIYVFHFALGQSVMFLRQYTSYHLSKSKYKHDARKIELMLT